MPDGPYRDINHATDKEPVRNKCFGLFAITKAFIPHFRENNGGTFINIASLSAQVNYPFVAAYGSSKWAVRGITESLGIELAPFNIQVKAIYPGIHANRIFTKLDDGANAVNPVFGFYKNYYQNFFSAQSAIPNVTSPENIAYAIYKAAKRRTGKLHILAGGDAKLLTFLKRILPQRAFQKLQIRNLLTPLSKPEISFAKWIMGKRVSKLEIILDEKLIN